MKMRNPISKSAILPWESTFKLERCNEALPGVSIVIPIYNSASFLEKTIRSLLCNNLEGVEIILMDGGSSDDTMKIVEYYKDIFSIIKSEKDKGQSDAINKGLALSTKDILYWLNGDDIILPNTLDKVRQYFKQNPKTEVLVGNAYMTELDFTPINHFTFNLEKLKFSYLLDYAKNHLIQPSVFFSRKAWETSGPLDIEDHYAMDADLFINMAKHFNFQHINTDIAYSVYHEECKTRGARAESITSLALVQAKHGGLKESKETLSILVSLYKELETKTTQEKNDAKIHALLSKINSLQTLQENQKELILKMDIEEHS